MMFLIRNGRKFEQVFGRLIEIPGFGKFYIDHRREWDGKNRLENYIGYAVTEPRTGMRVGDGGRTVRDAYESAECELEDKGWTKFDRAVQIKVEKDGELNDNR